MDHSESTKQLFKKKTFKTLVDKMQVMENAK